MSFLVNSLTPIINIASFSALPLPINANDSAIYRVNGVGFGGFSYWKTDNIVWFPINNEVKLYEFNGNTDEPVSVVSGIYTASTIQPFTTPELLVIPAGLLRANSKIRIEAFIGCITASVGASALIQFGNSIDGFVNVGSMSASSQPWICLNFEFNMISNSIVGIGGLTQLNEGSTVTVPAAWEANLNCLIRDCELLIGGIGTGTLRSFVLYGLSIWVIQ